MFKTDASSAAWDELVTSNRCPACGHSRRVDLGTELDGTLHIGDLGSQLPCLSEGSFTNVRSKSLVIRTSVGILEAAVECVDDMSRALRLAL